MRDFIKKISGRIPFFLLLLFSLIIAGCTAGDYTSQNNEKIADAKVSAFSFGDYTTGSKADSEDLIVQFLDVGQGSAALIYQNDSWMLVDGGDRDYSSYVVSYLRKQGVEELDYVVVSHYDSDHLSGIVGVLNALECKQILAPDYEEDTKIYQSFRNVTEEKQIPVTYAKPGESYAFAESEFQIIGPVMGAYEDANSNSIGIRLEYGDNSFLICGDATEETEQDILYQGMNISSDVFAANHHGSKYSNSEEFLEAVNPDYIVISCGEGNSYGHPDASVLLSVQKLGASLYRTDLQGTVTAVSDGETIRFENDVCMDYRSGTEIREELQTTSKDTTSKSENTTSDESFSDKEDSDITYVINVNSKKFHLPDCSSVEDINDNNKEYSTESREDLIEQGYSPCKRCEP